MIGIDTILITALALASFSAFVLILLAKWKVVEWMQVHGNDFFAKMANCDFCLSWWANVVFAIVFAVVTESWWVLLLPFFTTMITRKLI